MVYDISVIVKETGQVIYASDPVWCRIQVDVPEKVWWYGFEDTKGQSNVDFTFADPLLRVVKNGSDLYIEFDSYRGRYHVDVIAYGHTLWINAGGPEKNHVGEVVIVPLPEEIPKPPEVPSPPLPPIPPVEPPAVDITPITQRLDALISSLNEIKDTSAPHMANTYSLETIDLSVARSSFTEFTEKGFGITVYRNTGTFEIKIGDLATDSITVYAITYPAMLVIDNIEFNRFFIRNTAQAGAQAELIIWKRE